MFSGDAVSSSGSRGPAAMCIGRFAGSSSFYSIASPSGVSTGSFLLLPSNRSRASYVIHNSGALMAWFLHAEPVLEQNLIYPLGLSNSGPNILGPISIYTGSIWIAWFGSGTLSGNIAYGEDLYL